jgi:hypothetical protein
VGKVVCRGDTTDEGCCTNPVVLVVSQMLTARKGLLAVWASEGSCARVCLPMPGKNTQITEMLPRFKKGSIIKGRDLYLATAFAHIRFLPSMNSEVDSQG